MVVLLTVRNASLFFLCTLLHPTHVMCVDRCLKLQRVRSSLSGARGEYLGSHGVVWLIGNAKHSQLQGAPSGAALITIDQLNWVLLVTQVFLFRVALLVELSGSFLEGALYKF